MTSTDWHPDDTLLVTRITGTLSLGDVQAWQYDLDQHAARLPATFKLLVDLRGYEVSDQAPEVHRLQREVIPLFLARHGVIVGFFDLFGTTPSDLPATRQARCIAVAHVHHDAAKMALYNERLGRPEERFFTDPAEARAWLQHAGEEIPLPQPRPSAQHDGY